LIGSSFTMAMAVWAASTGRRRSQVWYLIATMILGSVFLGVKAKEYYDKWDECHIPGHVIGKGFNAIGGPGCERGNIAGEIKAHDEESHQPVTPEPARKQIAQQTEIFFSFYFAMTGLHAFHMIIGLGLLTWLLLRASRGEFNA